MTPEELKKLAEIAGLKIEGRYYIKGNGLVFNDSIHLDDWQPHERIEQAFMVEDKMPEFLRYRYIKELINIVTDGDKLNLYAEWIVKWKLTHATAEQRCRAALEALKEGK